MKTLMILRHAKSSWKQSELSDHDRPLNKRGLRQAPFMGRLLREESVVPDLILASTARRAQDTVEAVVQESGYEGEIQAEREFYPGDPDVYVQALRRQPDVFQRVMVVGHNPGLEALLLALTGEIHPLVTAALAEISLPISSWRELGLRTQGKLTNFWTPPD